MSIDLYKRLEYSFDIHGPDADPGVGHTDSHSALEFVARNVDRAAGEGKLRRVCNEVEQDLLKSFRIRHYGDVGRAQLDL
jgi:hypothetical protein